ncbi:MAG: hypothetical protein K1X92_14670 [Bacteroidia bacterium]|nr:hypothetical protein [Bacteroidia bacterium]
MVFLFLGIAKSGTSTKIGKFPEKDVFYYFSRKVAVSAKNNEITNNLSDFATLRETIPTNLCGLSSVTPKRKRGCFYQATSFFISEPV